MASATALVSDPLAWLVRLRWFAVIGQSATVIVVDRVLEIDLPLLALFGFIGVTAVSNLAATTLLRSGRSSPCWLATGLMVTDVAVITALLLFTGGAGNPFASFYLVHATMAALVLPARAAGLVWLLSSAGYGLLFLLRNHLAELHRHAICGAAMSYDLHLQGMLVSLILTSAAIAYFVNRVLHALRERDRELTLARTREAENERFAFLATLAAGVAHEIGSPLGTIAVAAGELRHAAAQLATDSAIREDAELIAEEVARCRAILDRLNERSGSLGDTPRRLAAGELVAEVQRALPPSQAVRLLASLRDQNLSLIVPPAAMAQALGVLVKNAFDASRADQLVRLAAEEVSGEVCFTIEDQGTGLTEAARTHAGEPFFTTKEPGRGMGLGLFLVRLLARRLNGSLRLETTSAGGTRAVLTVSPPSVA